MSSDPKGPETKPLTAANAARAMTLLVMASRVDPNLRSAVADVESYLAELQREIEGYRQALEKAIEALAAVSAPAVSRNPHSVGIVISMADVECGQPLDATLVVLADSDDEREVEWARSTADDIAARLNEHQAQAATIAELQREIGGYRQALENVMRYDRSRQPKTARG
jgi:hypothetical protein